MKKIISQMHKMIKDYKLINDGDKVAVALSCGKDSLAMLKALALWKIHSKIDFELIAITIDILGNTDYTKVQQFCQELDIEFFVVRSNIQEVVFDIRKEKSPCSLCAKLRRGNINTKAKELGCNKVALGHHADDLLQTFIMSLNFENRLNTLKPSSYLSRMDLTVIRPMLYVDEQDILRLEEPLPIIENSCPANKNTERENAKKILKNIEKAFPNFKEKMLIALTSPERYNLWKNIN